MSATTVAPAPVPAAVAAVPNVASAGPATVPSFQSVSLYVGDLHGDVTEANLFEVFSQVGTVQSIRVCRDIITRRSLGYAYVNFTNQSDAERALDTINGSEIKGRPCRIMWSQRDPSIRKSGRGNIFIKNLDKKIDIKALHDTFSQFGNILSCKIELDSKGESKGYGYIQFADADNASVAIEKVNGMMLLDKPVFVGPFVPRRERIQANSTKEFTNIFIKNLDEKVDDDVLRSVFGQVGAIKSVAVMRDADGKSKGFGFVNYEDANDAAAAVEELNGKDISGKPVFVGRAMKKSEREAELRQKFEQLKLEQMNKYHGVNLYVKNIDDEVDSDDKLRGIFAPYGTITSTKIMKDNRSLSKGFGFVCFGSPEEATKAVSELNGKMIGKKPLYVALHERKEVRRSKLEQHFAQRSKMPARMPPGVYPNGQPMFYPGNMPPHMMYPQHMVPRNRFPQPGFQGMPGGFMMMPGGRGGRGGFVNGRGATSPRGRGGLQQKAQAPVPQGAVPIASLPQVPPEALQAPTQPAAPGAAAPVHPIPAFNAQVLDQYPPEERKRLLGEQLYPLIARVQPNLAGKITGMILESADTKEIITLIERPAQLTNKINEAIEVLNQHQTVKQE
eukprot:TRINITY_DN400_c0_g1_i1.p2 TRINITY_DN400_c0_g1~~TRINITY_DN400_c0_g1_i1.p2  ORF type:complete len:617 (-),score=195.70 TRINITY_DN400_c0_g1_i1:165-2015(-)